MNMGRNKRYFITASAVIGIMLFSAVGMAGLMGWIPADKVSSQNGSGYGYALPISPDQPSVLDTGKTVSSPAVPMPVNTASANVATDSGDTVKTIKPVHREKAADTITKLPQQPTTAKTIKACLDCAKVLAINEVEQKGDSNGLGLVAGGVVGGLVGNQVGKGKGNVLMTVLGAGGGAYAGNEIQKKINSKKVYVVKLRTDDGKLHTLTEPAVPDYAVGDQVRLHDGKVSAV